MPNVSPTPVDGAVWMIRPDGSGARRVSAPGRTYADDADWSPAGRWLIVRSSDRVDHPFDLIDVATGETLPLSLPAIYRQPATRPF